MVALVGLRGSGGFLTMIELTSDALAMGVGAMIRLLSGLAAAGVVVAVLSLAEGWAVGVVLAIVCAVDVIAGFVDGLAAELATAAGSMVGVEGAVMPEWVHSHAAAPTAATNPPKSQILLRLALDFLSDSIGDDFSAGSGACEGAWGLRSAEATASGVSSGDGRVGAELSKRLSRTVSGLVSLKSADALVASVAKDVEADMVEAFAAG